MKYNITSNLGLIIIIIILTSVAGADVCSDQYSDECLYSKMIAKKEEYPEGTRWTNDNCYSSKYIGGGCGCAGFAYLLSDVCFGEIKAKKLDVCSDFKVGDVVRINPNTHSIFILKIDTSNEIITIAEGNYASTIHWGRTFKISALKGNCNYILRRNPS